jgi:hypothetical protein
MGWINHILNKMVILLHWSSKIILTSLRCAIQPIYADGGGILRYYRRHC